MKRIISGFFAVVFLLVLAAAAQAGGGVNSPVTIDNIPNIIGVAGGQAPDYQGSNDYKFVGAPFFKFTFWGERYATLIGTEFNVNVVNDPVLRFGLSVNYHPGRDSSVDDPVVSKMQKIDNTAEAGAFIGAQFIDKSNPRNRFTITFDFLDDVGDVYNGYTFTLSARYWVPLSRPIDFSIGASSTFADNNYMSTYFGVSPADSVRSGLPVYNASSGIKDVSVSPAIVYHLSKTWHVAVGAKYSRLLDDAKDSPVVALRGSADQWVYGLGVAYSW
jgi:outer membrane protein